jgi:putative colanic acid biosynthesis acetyltransferase WcaF
VLWFATSHMFFQKWWMPARCRPSLLRLFGAQIGQGVFIRHNVRVLWPWKLSLGDWSWLGEDSWILNLEPVSIGENVCVSQGVFICTGSHDTRSATFEYDNAPIVIEDGVWIAARATLLRGALVSAGTVVSAGTIVRRQ